MREEDAAARVQLDGLPIRAGDAVRPAAARVQGRLGTQYPPRGATGRRAARYPLRDARLPPFSPVYRWVQSASSEASSASPLMLVLPMPYETE